MATDPNEIGHPTDPEAVRLAKTYVWWEPPATVLDRPRKLLCQILKMGTAADYAAALKRWPESHFRDAIEEANPGDLDERSWVFWRRIYGLPDKSFPKRRFK